MQPLGARDFNERLQVQSIEQILQMQRHATAIKDSRRFTGIEVENERSWAIEVWRNGQ